jgi:hypothetical protein
MKKWLITHLFIVCSICLHIGGFANPAKTNRTANNIKSAYTTTPGVFTLEKASLTVTDHQAESNRDIFFQHHSIRVLYSVSSYFKAEPNFFFKISNHVPGEAISEKEVERVLKDHLLHLFPFHYFW